MRRHIEAYLKARGVRYFRGHRDGEFFFRIDLVAGACRGRLTVHLEVDDDAPDSVGVVITPDRYFPAERAVALEAIAQRWNSQETALAAVVHGSCDPRLVGVQAGGRFDSVDVAALTDFVDSAVTAAIELFEEMARAAAPAVEPVLRDAG